MGCCSYSSYIVGKQDRSSSWLSNNNPSLLISLEILRLEIYNLKNFVKDYICYRYYFSIMQYYFILVNVFYKLVDCQAARRYKFAV